MIDSSYWWNDEEMKKDYAEENKRFLKKMEDKFNKDKKRGSILTEEDTYNFYKAIMRIELL